MKFKRNRLNEGFEYSQWALDDAKALVNMLDEFVDNYHLIIGGADHITEADIKKLADASDVLTEFLESYDVFATRQANNFNRERRK